MSQCGRFSIVVGTFYILAVPIILVLRSVWNIGQAIIKANLFPAPGMKVIRDTVLVTGSKAVLFSAVFLALPIVLWLILWRLIDEV